MKKILIFILILTIIILGLDFFAKSGTYFLLDGTFVPADTIRYSFWEQSIFWFFNDLFTVILGYVFYSKLFYFGILFSSGFLGYILAKGILKYADIDKKYENIGGIFGILFMMMNPFLYERMITQPGVYLAIVLLGYGSYFLMKDIDLNETKNYLLTGMLFGMSVTLSQHVIFMIAVTVLVYSIFFLRDKKNISDIIYMGSIVIFLNLNWLIGNLFFQKGYIINSLNSFGQGNIDNFFTNSIAPLGVESTNALLYGFWGERYGHLLLPGMMNENWFIAGFLILLVIIFGFYRIFLKNKKLASFLAILGVTSLILGTGTASHVWGGFTQFLYDHVPYYIGLREPQKWIGVLMLVYCIFFVSGFTYIFSFFDKFFKIRENRIKASISVFIVFLFLNGWSPNVLFAFNKQLFMADYPKEFFTFKNERFKKDEKYLALPWHSYFSCDWTRGRIIPNPAGEFLNPQNVITSDNIEIGTLYSNSSSQRSKDIEEFLKTHDATILKKYGISDIIFLDKCGDFKAYDFLKKDRSFKADFESDHLKTYRIN